MRRILSVTLAATALLCTTLPAAARCDRSADTSAFVQGGVNGTWVGLVLMFDGTNGGATSASAYATVPGGNGFLTQPLSKITAVTRPGDAMDGDRMSGFVRNGRLYVTNAVYGKGEAHCCATHVAVRRYTFVHGRLTQEAAATLATASLYATGDEAADSCAARDAQQRHWEDAIVKALAAR